MPKLKDEKTFLLFKYIGDKTKFNEMLEVLKQKKINILVENLNED